VGFGSMWLSPRINEFIHGYPEINLKLNYSEDEQDMLRQNYDIGIWMRRPKHLDLISKHIATIKYHIYGSAHYINEMGMPIRRSELNKHRLITYGTGKPSPLSDTNWILKTGVAKNQKTRKPHITINNLYGLLVAVETGAGLAALPDYMVQHKAHLVKVLPEIEGPSYEVHMVYHENLKGSLKLIAFRDFLMKKIDQWRF
jgi:DNA-binding transcriptional LysR family regulator